MKCRNTVQKQMILQAVYTLKNHPTAEDVYNEVIKTYPDISLATVYRNLNLLSESGKLLKISIPNAPVRFDQTINQHYHITCSRCKRFFDIPLPYQAQIDKDFSSATGFSINSHDIVFNGFCKDCKQLN